MNPAEMSPVAPKKPKDERPKNCLEELLQKAGGEDLKENRLKAIPKNLPEEAREKSRKNHGLLPAFMAITRLFTKPVACPSQRDLGKDNLTA